MITLTNVFFSANQRCHAVLGGASVLNGNGKRHLQRSDSITKRTIIKGSSCRFRRGTHHCVATTIE
jgi:hypothetical protein